MVICDCTTLTQAGYVGDDIDSVISKLLHVSQVILAPKSVYNHVYGNVVDVSYTPVLPNTSKYSVCIVFKPLCMHIFPVCTYFWLTTRFFYYMYIPQEANFDVDRAQRGIWKYMYISALAILEVRTATQTSMTEDCI